MLMREIVIFFVNYTELFLIIQKDAQASTSRRHIFTHRPIRVFAARPKANVSIVANDGKLSYA